MADVTPSSKYNQQPAQQLLARMRHQLNPDQQRVTAAAHELLGALSTVGAATAPGNVTTGRVIVENGELSVVIDFPPSRGSRRRVTVSYVSTTFRIGMTMSGSNELWVVPLVYDAAHGTFIPSVAVVPQADPAAPTLDEVRKSAATLEQVAHHATPLEVLLMAAWEFATQEPSTSPKDFTFGTRDL